MNPQVFTNTLRSRGIESAKKKEVLLQSAAAKLKQERVDKILADGIGPMDVAEALRGEARGNQRNPMPVSYEMFGQGPQGAPSVRREISGEDAALKARLAEMGQSPDLARAMAGRQMPGAREAASSVGASVMGAMADEGTRGDIARVGAVSLGVGGITASGAALIDLMQFLSQGQEVDQERNQVLPS
jgi:hypothetical protein